MRKTAKRAAGLHRASLTKLDDLDPALELMYYGWRGMTLTAEPSGETVLFGWVPDQSALQCLLRKVHELGLALISVRRCREDQTASSK